VSTSWGQCEIDEDNAGLVGTLTPLFKQAALQGQTIVAAAGDAGSEDCYDAPMDSTAEEVDYPAADPWVTGVGGTTLATSGSETVWNNCLASRQGESLTCANDADSKAAGGGGMSRYETRPSYQPNLLTWPTAQTCGTQCREVPDISANAGTPMVIATPPDAAANSTWGGFRGTSLSAPLIAGLVADRNTGCTTSTGLLTTGLYSLAAAGAYGTALRDITVGNNDMTGSNGRAYAAGTGYAAATGLGTPMAAGLSCPEVTSTNPTSGAPGMTVTIAGLGLEQASILFGSTPAVVSNATATSATVTVPAVTGTMSVSATDALGAGTETSVFNPPPPTPAPTPAPTPTVPLATAPPSSGYDMVGSDGGVFVFSGPGESGGFFGSLPGLGVSVNDVVGMVPSSDDGGYFLVGRDGGVFAFGDGSYEGSLPGDGVTVDNIAGIVPTADNRGYFLVGADGGVFAFGDAPFLGSLPGDGVDVDDVIGIAATPDDRGYWVVEANGAVHAFGDAPDLGSVSDSPSPVSGIAATPDGHGYWVVTQGGGVYSFGDAGSFGSPAQSGLTPARPVIGLVPTADQGGYWLIGSDGGIFAYGDAGFDGSLPADGVDVADIVGAVPTR
jgi:hypothetical protein